MRVGVPNSAIPRGAVHQSELSLGQLHGGLDILDARPAWSSDDQSLPLARLLCADVEHDDCELLLEALFERFLARHGAHTVDRHAGQDGLVGQKASGLIIDEQYGG
ncbi:MAG TPA: hypothetical protein VJT80_03170 [Steroidobacteraceae bacterium]|nr:hypothetical protein [Steroidobacteraceae bacterium]